LTRLIVLTFIPFRKKIKPAAPVYDSDDERTYANEKIPDKEDDSYFYDDVDEFHASRDKILLDKGASLPQPADLSEEVKTVICYTLKFGKFITTCDTTMKDG
jgi:hypothetical protein